MRFTHNALLYFYPDVLNFEFTYNKSCFNFNIHELMCLL